MKEVKIDHFERFKKLGVFFVYEYDFRQNSVKILFFNMWLGQRTFKDDFHLFKES